MEELKVIFIVPVWYENNRSKICMSPFLMPQIEALIMNLDVYEIVHLEAGFDFKTVCKNIVKLVEIRRRFKGYKIFTMYGSLHGFLTRLILGRDFKILISFGGSDLLGSANKGVVWGLRNKLTGILSCWTSRHVSHVIVKSENLMLPLKSLERSKISIVPNGVQTDVFKPLPNRECIRQKLKWDDNFVVLFNLRRGNSELEHVKNLPLALSTIDALRKLTTRNIRFEIISGKSHEQLNELFNAGDCLLLTSLHEGSPNIIKEAMSTNLPIVAVKCGDVEERLEKVKNSYVVESYSRDDLALACKRIMENGSRSNSRTQLFEQKLDSISVASRIHNILMRL